MTRSSACLLASTLALTACSSSSDVEIATTPLAGKIGGQAWSFQAGSTDAFLSEGEDDFFAAFYATAYTPCGFSDPSGPHVLVSVPKTPGDYDMDLFRNMTFVDTASNNLIATDGRIVIDSVTATTVTGSLHGTYDGGNEINGTFQLTVCAD